MLYTLALQPFHLHVAGPCFMKIDIPFYCIILTIYLTFIITHGRDVQLDTIEVEQDHILASASHVIATITQTGAIQ